MRLPHVRFTVRRMVAMGLVFIAAGLAGGWMFPMVTWVGPAARNLRFRVLYPTRGVPVPGARVALVHPYDPEQTPIEGVTDADGEVELRGEFRRFGGTDAWGRDRVTYFSYSPWEVEARAEGFQGYTAALGEQTFRSPGPPGAREPLRLGDPAPSPIAISTRPLAGKDQTTVRP